MQWPVEVFYLNLKNYYCQVSLYNFMGILRLLLALAVVIQHTSPVLGFTFTGGQVSVQAFFIISGFYMSLILNEKYIKENNSYWLFLSNRLMRLYPIYWSVLILTIIVACICGQLSNETPYFDLYAKYYDQMSFFTVAYLIFTNIFLFGQDVIMFLQLDTTSGNMLFAENFWKTDPKLYKFLFVPQAWTVGLELSFYLLAPFLVRKKVAVILVVIALSVILRFFLYKQGLKTDPWNYRFFPIELAFFLFGNLSYVFYRRSGLAKFSQSLSLASLAYVLLFTVMYGFLPFSPKKYIYVISLIVLIPIIFEKTKNWHFDRVLGELSYPVYISHLLILLIFNQVMKYYDGVIPASMEAWKGLIVILGTLAISIVLNKVIAEKVERIRQLRVISHKKATKFQVAS